MSLLQQHFEERREYIFNRLKQPEYMERSIEKVRQAQKEIKNTVRTIKDLLLLGVTIHAYQLKNGNKMNFFHIN
ncbi:hypothetical protein CN448_25735 [Bacillus cereus]|uniref:hypothetical protein n=1 Tax=Bacillus cereus TaxID=1396 RepID=UPI000BF40E7C|nr:hypothetical protein [Bacillus cereus]PEW65107.1 hypothetical protein CN448_25735 [Bacillus cereus]